MKVQDSADSGNISDKPLDLQHHILETPEHCPLGLSGVRRKRARDQLGRLIAASISVPGKWISYSRNRSHYGQKAAPAAYQRTMDAIRWLEALGIIDHDRVKPHAPGPCPGKQSRFKLNADGLAMFGQATIFYDGPLIVAKSSRKEVVECLDTPETVKIRAEIEEINDYTRRHRIDAPGNPCFDLRMVANHEQAGRPLKLTRGCRLYCQATNMRSVDRDRIKIDGEETDDIDFSHMHPSILHELIGIPLNGHPYDIPGFTHDEAKVGWMCFMYTQTRKAAVAALAYDRKTRRKRMDRARAEELISTIARRSGTPEGFPKDLALILQRVDSEFTRIICLRLARQGIPCLPVHDSYRVRKSDTDARKAAISDAWDEVRRGKLLTSLKRQFSALAGTSFKNPSDTMGFSPSSRSGLSFQQPITASGDALPRDATLRGHGEDLNRPDEGSKTSLEKIGDFSSDVPGNESPGGKISATVTIIPEVRSIDHGERTRRQQLVRKLEKFSQAQLARKLNVSRGYMSMLVSGKRRMSEKISNALIAIDAGENRKRVPVRRLPQPNEIGRAKESDHVGMLTRQLVEAVA